MELKILHLKRYLLLLCAIILAVIIVIYVTYILTASADGPCSFFDTVNVTGDIKFANGSYLHEGVIIPAEFIRSYDYIYKHENRLEVETHLRGCICHLKTCVNLCCPWGTKYSAESGNCENTTRNGLMWPDSTLDVAANNGTIETVDIFEQFAVQIYRPCTVMFALNPEMYETDNWTLFENGSLLRVNDMEYLEKDKFCLLPVTAKDNENYVINPANCKEVSEEDIVRKTNAFVMLISLPFMVLTIAVYIIIPNLLTTHGKSLICYLLGLIVGYSLLIYNILDSQIEPDTITCKVVGYVSYYFFMVAFFWLSIISFDLWNTFRTGFNRVYGSKQFLLYSLYAWGLALIFLTVTCLIQELTDIPYELKPGIGGGKYCWLDMTNWSALIYFYGPIILIILTNTTMFGLTARNIRRQELEMSRFTANENSSKNLHAEKDKYGVFLRLFVVMGITWSMEIISYLCSGYKWSSRSFYITDACNAAQGLLIFILFVLKKSVRVLIINKFWKPTSPGSSKTNSTSSTTTQQSESKVIPDQLELQTRARDGGKSE